MTLVAEGLMYSQFMMHGQKYIKVSELH